jgi:hypothetical protein
MTDAQAVLRLLRLRGPSGLTPLEALREVGTFRLAARVWELRRDGHVIETERVKLVSGSSIARYTLVES